MPSSARTSEKAIIAALCCMGALAPVACGLDLVGAAATVTDAATVELPDGAIVIADTGVAPPEASTGDVVVPPGDAGPYSTRVRTDLIALYEMEEGGGSTLNDTSGFGTPLPLTFVNAADVAWTKGAVAATNNNRARSAAAATKIITACAGTSQLTIEAWLTIGSSLLSNYARIVTLATTADDFDAAMTTTHQQLAFGLLAGGGRAYTYAAITSGLRHVVYTFAANTKNIYVDGVLVSSLVQVGDFTGWVATHPLALFNTAALDRPMFPGELHLVAIYSRALTTAEIAVNRAAGPDP